MGDWIRNERIGDLITELLPLAARVKVETIYWIETPDGDGGEWCGTCGAYKVHNLRRHDRARRQDYHLDGGYRTDRDNTAFCAGCGVVLDVSLTREGALEELDHFLMYGVAPANPHHAREVMEMLSTLEFTKPDAAAAADEAADVAEALLWSAT